MLQIILISLFSISNANDTIVCVKSDNNTVTISKGSLGANCIVKEQTKSGSIKESKVSNSVCEGLIKSYSDLSFGKGCK